MQLLICKSLETLSPCPCNNDSFPVILVASDLFGDIFPPESVKLDIFRYTYTTNSNYFTVHYLYKHVQHHFTARTVMANGTRVLNFPNLQVLKETYGLSCNPKSAQSNGDHNLYWKKYSASDINCYKQERVYDSGRKWSIEARVRGYLN